VDTTLFPRHGTVARQRATVAIPVVRRVRREPVCARQGCHWTAWFMVHHVSVCSLDCAQGIALEIARERDARRQRARGRSHAGTAVHASRVA